MTALIYKFVQISLLRAVPQDLPGQTLVLWLSVAMAALTGIAGLLIYYSVGESLIRTITVLVVPAVFLYVALSMKNLRSRFIQAYTAMCGTSAVVYVVALPFLPAFFEAIVATQHNKFIVYVILLLDIWTVVVTAHILKHTLDIGMASGVSMAIAMMVMTLVVVEIVSPMQSVDLSPQVSLTFKSRLLSV
ncbi:hypothetical protein AB833_29645 [Chromatiales bacterium (ex Bugula neritina AB1)]|nr:hypothetical protein AB833_29645 [Chromatiales bacterium (ex Bugula neritina AB1)]